MLTISFWLALGLLLFAGLHFLPTFVAVARQHRHALLLFVLNLLLAWTGIGWLILLIWAAVGESNPSGSARSLA